MKNIQTDVLVIGSGIAGLNFTRNAATAFPDKHVLLITKTQLEESNTRYAQGGIAAVLNMPSDSFEQHIRDTIAAGDGRCNVAVVDMCVKEGPARIAELRALGARFDTLPDGKPQLGKEGGHSSHRIVHAKDQTGLEIQNTLLRSVKALPNVQILCDCFAVDLLISSDGRCGGVHAIDFQNKDLLITAAATMLATGGAGQVYATTTNPTIATGDGFALAYRAGAQLENMAFVQFHPTALYDPGRNPSFLISEAVRGFGGILRNSEGEDFMLRYDERGSLATRDVVSRAMFHEMKRTDSKHLWLDLRHTDLVAFSEAFPNISSVCAQLGLNLRQMMIPVAPAAHYMCGGVKTDTFAQTSIQGLLCAGETACTGLHGANRLASNSLLEALVLSHRAVSALNQLLNPMLPRLHPSDFDVQTLPTEHQLSSFPFAELQSMMSLHAGIMRSRAGLKEIARNIEQWQQGIGVSNDRKALEWRNLLDTASQIVLDSLAQEQSKGCLCVTEDAA